MSPQFPSWTKTWHSESYPDISPTRPELSTKGKAIVVTGEGTGIGAEISGSFAASGAASIAIVSRTKSRLDATKVAIETKYPRTKILPIASHITKESQVAAAFEDIEKSLGKIDVFVSNSSYMPSFPAKVADSGLEDWWQTHETNTKGAFLSFKESHKHAKEFAFVFHISSGIGHMPPLTAPLSAYATSKAAATKLFDYVSTEYPQYYVVNIQPGVVLTDLNLKSSMPAMDHVDLPGHFTVWLTSPEAAFLKGKFVWVNWDVNELIARKDETIDKETMTTMLSGVSISVN